LKRTLVSKPLGFNILPRCFNQRVSSAIILFVAGHTLRLHVIAKVFLIRTKMLVKHLAPSHLLRNASTYKHPRLEGTSHRLENDTRVVRGTRSPPNFERCLQRATHAMALEDEEDDKETMTIT